MRSFSRLRLRQPVAWLRIAFPGILASLGFFGPSELKASPFQDAKDLAGTDRPILQGDSPKGLLRIAALEAGRARAKYAKIAESIFEELETTSDPTLGMVQQRVSALNAMGIAILPVLEKQLSNASLPGSNNRARAAAQVLGDLLRAEDHELASEATRRGLESENSFAQAQFAAAAGLSGDAEWVESLESLLEHAETDVIVSAIGALSDIGATSARLSLLKILNHDKGKIRNQVVSALAKLDDGAASEELIPLLEASWLTEDVQIALIEYTGQHGRLRAIQNLAEFLDTESTPLKMSVTLAIRDIGLREKGAASSRAITVLRPQLVESSKSQWLEHVARCLHELGDKSGLEKLVKIDTSAIRKTPQGFRAYLNRANTYFDFGEYGDAITDAKMCLKNDRRNVMGDTANSLLAAAYAGLGNYRSAKGHLRRLRRTHPSELVDRYQELVKMAKDPKYADLFE